MKLNCERELPPNSQDRKSVSSFIIEQVAPRSFTPLLSKLRFNLVSMREEGRASTSFVQNIRYEASSGTLAYIYQERTVKPTRATVLGYIANHPLEWGEFENVPWYDTRTGQLQGRFNEGPSAAAANGAIRKTAQRKPDNKYLQFASGSNRQPIIERGGGGTLSIPTLNLTGSQQIGVITTTVTETSEKSTTSIPMEKESLAQYLSSQCQS